MLRALLAAASVGAIGCAVPSEPAPVQLRGRLVGHDGAPLRAAHLELEGREVAVAADGSFAAELVAGRLHLLIVAGADHASRSLSVLGEGPGLELSIQLGTQPRRQTLDDVRLVRYGAMGPRGLEQTDQVDMTAGPDGVWTATIAATPGDEVLYGIAGVVAQEGRSVNGTEGELRYDGGGDFASVIRAAGAQLTVTFDPRRLPPAAAPARQALTPGGGTAAAILALASELRDTRDVLFLAQGGNKLAAAPQEPRPSKSAWQAQLQERLASTPPSLLRQALLVAYFGLPTWLSDDGGDGLETERWRREAFETIPPASPAWGLSSEAWPQIAGYAAGRFLDELLAAQPAGEVAATLALQELEDATLRKDRERQRHYLALFDGRLAATYQARLVAARRGAYDPARALKVGARLPDFDLPAFERAGRVTPATYTGSWLLVELWGTWCTPCVADLPTLELVHRHLGPAGLRQLSIAVDDKPDAVRDLRAKRSPMPWDHVVLQGEEAERVQGLFGTLGVPAYALVDPKGTIVALNDDVRGTDMVERIERFMKAPSAATAAAPR